MLCVYIYIVRPLGVKMHTVYSMGVFHLRAALQFMSIIAGYIDGRECVNVLPTRALETFSKYDTFSHKSMLLQL